MSRVRDAAADYLREASRKWDQFWFVPTFPHVLCGMRIATGMMLLYSQLILGLHLFEFYGNDAWVDNQAIQQLYEDRHMWSYLWYVESPVAIQLHQSAALVAAAAFMLGLFTRITGPLSLFFQLMTVHRLFGALFGFDQVVTMLTMYLCFAPVGSMWSLDSLLREKGWFGDRPRLRRWLLPDPSPSIAANIFTRLIQLHVCVIYLFGGIGKMRGEMWWDGTALWFAAANLEYQSLDITWIAHYPLLFAFASNLTVFWETFYVALVWPRLTRPIMLAIAVLVHGGIAIALGMITFGSLMIVANAAFLKPEWIRSLTTKKGAPST